MQFSLGSIAFQTPRVERQINLIYAFIKPFWWF
jgi:hypothetical protein